MPCDSICQIPLSLRKADLQNCYMSVVRAECPSGDPISSVLAVVRNVQSVIWQLRVPGARSLFSATIEAQRKLI